MNKNSAKTANAGDSGQLWLVEVFPELQAPGIEVEVSGLSRSGVREATAALLVAQSGGAQVLRLERRSGNAGDGLRVCADREALLHSSQLRNGGSSRMVADRRRFFVATGVGKWDAEALVGEAAARLNRPGPGVVPAGTALKVLSGASLRPRIPSWPITTMASDLRMGEAVESSNLGTLTVVATRDTASLPSGSTINVTVTRGLSSEVCTPDWTSRPEGHPICLLVADTLQGLAASTVSLDWSIGGTPYSASGPVHTLEPGNTRYVLFGGPLQKKAQAEWISGALDVGDLVDQ